MPSSSPCAAVKEVFDLLGSLQPLSVFLTGPVGLDRPCLALGVCEPVTARRCRRSVGTVSGGGGGEAHLEGGSSPASHVEVRWHTVRSGESWRRALASAHRVPRETEKACGPRGRGADAGESVQRWASLVALPAVEAHPTDRRVKMAGCSFMGGGGWFVVGAGLLVT